MFIYKDEIFGLTFVAAFLVNLSRPQAVASGEAREHDCHAVHAQSFSEIKILFRNIHGQNACNIHVL